MSFVGDAIGSVVGGITGAKDQAKAAERASETQAGAAEAGIREQRRQFDEIVQLMRPYVTAGTGALQGQQSLLGLRGAGSQERAIAGLEASPQFQTLVQQGEEALLQNAAATGGLRGGNIQEALAQFRPQILSQLIESQYGKLGGIAQIGQASAAGQASAGQQTGTNVANLLQQQGAARAGGQLAGGSVNRQAFTDLLNIGKTAASAFGAGGF